MLTYKLEILAAWLFSCSACLLLSGWIVLLRWMEVFFFPLSHVPLHLLCRTCQSWTLKSRRKPWRWIWTFAAGSISQLVSVTSLSRGTVRMWSRCTRYQEVKIVNFRDFIDWQIHWVGLCYKLTVVGWSFKQSWWCPHRFQTINHR